ncbi:hypothetical protein CUR95_24105 [Bordetella bronchiseptica]|nr:hypothetical protein [Bordetella bronchiseptica]
MDTPNPPTDFKAFYLALPADARAKFALRAGTTVAYIETHLLYARKIPRKKSMDRLWVACDEFGANFDQPDLLAFFFGARPPSPAPELAERQEAA